MLPTPINAIKLAPLLKTFPQKNLVLRGITRGFDLGFTGVQGPQSCNNNLSINLNPLIALEKINKEIALGRIAGPFPHPPLPNFKCSPLSLKEKSTPGQYRLLHNLSYPHDSTSVNHNIPRDLCSTNYKTLDDALQAILTFERPFLAKSDIADAFRLLPIAPSSYNLTGFSLKGQYYYDRCLPMGAASSCLSFEHFSDSLSHALSTHYGVSNIIKVLDDFLFVTGSYESSAKALQAFKLLCDEINVPIAHHKTEGPSTELVFLGIHIDTKNQIVSIPTEKITQYSAMITSVLQCSSITLRELRSLTGKLAFVCRIIPPGRCFLRRLYDLTIGHTSPYAKINLSTEAQQDLLLWKSFLHSYNAKEYFSPRKEFTSEKDSIFTDASTTGYGATYGGNFLYGSFPPNWDTFDIQLKELYPIYLILATYAKAFSNSSLLIRTDNTSVAAALNNLTSRNSLVMKLLRKLVLIIMNNNIKCKAIHIKGEKNTISGALSRHQVPKALSLLRSLGYTPKLITVPHSLRPTNLKL